MMSDFSCYDGPPVWILPPELSAICRQLPQDQPGVSAVSVEMSNGKMIPAAVAYDRLIEIPDPYTVRDIVMIRKLYG